MNWVVVDSNGQQVSGTFVSSEEAEKTKKKLQESTGQTYQVKQVLLG